MIIQVTQDHIDRGNRHECEYCPVALAIKEATGEQVSVGYQSLRFKESKKYFVLPANVTNWILSLDRTNSGNPFSFEIDL